MFKLLYRQLLLTPVPSNQKNLPSNRGITSLTRFAKKKTVHTHIRRNLFLSLSLYIHPVFEPIIFLRQMFRHFLFLEVSAQDPFSSFFKIRNPFVIYAVPVLCSITYSFSLQENQPLKEGIS